MQPVKICRKTSLQNDSEIMYEESSLQTSNEKKYEIIQLLLMCCNGNINQKRNKITSPNWIIFSWSKLFNFNTLPPVDGEIKPDFNMKNVHHNSTVEQIVNFFEVSENSNKQ